MSRSANLVLIIAAWSFTLAASGQTPAVQRTAAASNPVGVWRGVSVCSVRPSPCNDEVVVYRIVRVNAGDNMSLDARKIVHGREEEMGVIGCHFAAPGPLLTCMMPNGAWHFTMRGDSLVGELRLPDRTKYREVRTARAR